MNANIYKGLEIILETAALLRANSNIDFEWNVVGIKPNSQLVRAIEKITKKKFNSNGVFFKGEKNEQELVISLKDSHIFIHSSHIDNSPNSVCEAMLLGMPVIAGFVGGVSSIIENKVNGLLYNSNDPYDLAGIIKEKVKNMSELEKFGQKAREHALKKHDPEEIVNTILNTYEKILGDKVHDKKT